MTTDWTVHVTNIFGDDFGSRAGVAADRATAALAMFAAAHECVDEAADTTPVYVLQLDGNMVAMVATGRSSIERAPGHTQAHTRLRELQPRILTAALSRN